MMQGMDRRTGDYNEFWAGRDYLNDMEPMKAALLMSHGFNDWNVMPEHSYRIYEAARAKGLPVQIYYHQEGHGGPPPLSMMNKWFTRFLHGIENGVENEPKAWIVRENDSPNEPTAYDDYPNPDAQAVTLYPFTDSEGHGSLVLNKPEELSTEIFTDNSTLSGKDLAISESNEHRLLFMTPALTRDVHLSGISEITIRLASSKPAANLSVWLVSLPWNDNEKAHINENIITRGWADPQNHASLTESEPLVPGEFYNLTFTLMPDDQVIPTGQQIALMIFSSDNEFTILPKPGTQLTIDLSATKLVLPVVGGNSILLDAFKN